MAFGGTLTLDFSSFFQVIGGVVRSLHRHGFRKVCLLNAHGGNVAALQTVVEELTRELDLKLLTATYWALGAKEMAAHLERQEGVRHACEAETSMMMAIAPDLVDSARFEEAAYPDARDIDGTYHDGAYRWVSFEKKTPSGALGDPRVATAAKGERLLATAANCVARKLLDVDYWGPD
jgi:creatinine amidohydrolase